MGEIAEQLLSVWGAASDLVVRGYEAAPALMLGLAILAIVPVVALLTPAVEAITRQAMPRPADATRRFRPQIQGDDIAGKISGAVAGHAAPAYLEVVGNEAVRFAIVRDMLRIGREDDNDVRIPSQAVHRYHAAVFREADTWFVSDLSGSNGNGIRLNGKPCFEACLKDGDIIELGPGRLRFRSDFS